MKSLLYSPEVRIGLNIYESKGLSIEGVFPRRVAEGPQYKVPVVVTTASMEAYFARGSGRVASDGLNGVVVDGTPAAARVRILQEKDGLLHEVRATVTEDGAWDVQGLPMARTYLIAEVPERNAGIVSGVTPVNEE